MITKNILFLAAAALVVVFAASKIVTNVSPKPALLPKQTIININAVGNSKTSGTATLEDVAGNAVILLKFPSLSGDNETIFPAYIHEGTCTKMGGIKYTLAVPDAGESETDLDISSDQLKQSAPITIDLEKSLKDQTVLACGEITK